MRHFDFIVYGNNVGAMVSAIVLAKRYKVAMVNPSPNWGGIFSGIKINGVQFDIGMVFLEFDSFHAPSDDLASYNPGVHNDSARFLHWVEKFLAQRINFTEAGQLRTLWRGRFYEDFVIANRLQILSSLPDDLKESVVNDLEEITAKERSALHAANKKSNQELFAMTDYHEVSLANHGDTLHGRLIAPFCQKVLGIAVQEVCSLFHRLAWCPLYHPETLLAAIRGEKNGMPETRFHYPQGTYFARIIEILTAEILENGNVTLIREAPQGLLTDQSPTLSFEDGRIAAKKMIWGGDLQQLQTLSGAPPFPFSPQKTSITFVFVEVDEKSVLSEFSTAFVCDEDCCVYRVTNQDTTRPERDRKRFVFEMNAGRLDQNGIEDDNEIIDYVRKFAERENLFNVGTKNDQYTVRRFQNALTLPTRKNVQAFDKMRGMLECRAEDIDSVGAAAIYPACSFNDQMVMALKVGETYAPD